MAKIRYLIEVYYKQQNGDDYISTPDISIRDGIALDSDGSISTTADSFQFRVHNYKLNDGSFKYTNAFRVDDRIKIYINGVLMDSTTVSDAPTDGAGSNSRLTLGRGLAGSMFGVRITPEEFSASQVLESYNRVRGRL